MGNGQSLTGSAHETIQMSARLPQYLWASPFVMCHEITVVFKLVGKETARFVFKGGRKKMMMIDF